MRCAVCRNKNSKFVHFILFLYTSQACIVHTLHYTLMEMSNRMSIVRHYKRTFLPIQYENMSVESAHKVSLCRLYKSIHTNGSVQR